MLLHGLFQALYVAVDITIEKSEKEAEVLRVPLVRRSRHEQVVVGAVRQSLAKLICKGLLVCAVCTHLVSFINDD